MRCRFFRVLMSSTLLWVWVAGMPVPAEEVEGSSPPQEALELWQKGYVLHMLQRYADAVEMYRQSIELHPTAEAQTYLGWSLSHMGRLEEAIAEAKKAIPLDPDFGNPYNDIGVYLTELGRLDEAVPWLEKATKAERYCCYQFPHFNLGRIQLRFGKIEAARRSFERALSYDPGYPPALKGLEVVNQQEQTL